MKLTSRILTLVAVLLTVLSATGCDQVRKLAGRPTSSDIQAIRERIAADEARAKAVADSIALAQKLAEQERRDSIAAIEAFAEHAGYLRVPSDVHGIRRGELDHRYYVAIGAFRQEANALRLADRLDREKYAPTVIFTGAGLNVVLVCPRNRIMDAYTAYMGIRNDPESPREAWVLVNDENWKKK